MKKVALFLADGFEEIEALGTVDILRRAEVEVTTVSINNTREVIGAHQVKIIADALFSEIDFSSADMLVLPGGMPGAQNLKEHKALQQRILEFAQKNKLIAAICAAPMVLGSLQLLKGKKATAYPGFESELVGAEVTNQAVAVDGNITTGKGPGLMFDFALQLVEELAGKSKRKEVADGLLLHTEA